MECGLPCLLADGAALHGYCDCRLLPDIGNVSNGVLHAPWVGCYDGVNRGGKRFGGAVGPGQRTSEPVSKKGALTCPV